MKRWALRLAAMLAILFLGLTVVNASWLADQPIGAVKLVAQDGLGPAPPVSSGECDASAPYHGVAPNSVQSAVRADALGAAMVALRVELDAQGEAILARGTDCGDGMATPVSALIPQMGRHARLMFVLPGDDGQAANAVLHSLASAGRDPVAARDGFVGSRASLAPVRAHSPAIWAWSPIEARECSRDYILLGWTGFLPDSCKGQTMLIPLHGQFPYWGWPNRLLARMDAHDGAVVIAGPGDPAPGALVSGIDLPEQLGEVPSTFNGYLWVDDSFAILPALYPRFDRRRQEEIDATERALAARRAAR